jgi:hypothetical protein
VSTTEIISSGLRPATVLPFGVLAGRQVKAMTPIERVQVEATMTETWPTVKPRGSELTIARPAAAFATLESRVAHLENRILGRILRVGAVPLRMS